MTRILALSVSSRGLGFAVMEDQESLIDWGVKTVKGDKNPECLKQVVIVSSLYLPDVLLLEDASSKGSRRSPRIRELGIQLRNLCKARKMKLVCLSRETVRKSFFGEDTLGTKHDLARILADQFPEELGSRLPPKRKPWTSEDYRMDIFDAVALGVCYLKRIERKP